MKRYSIKVETNTVAEDHGVVTNYLKIRPDDEGEWVRFEDIERLLPREPFVSYKYLTNCVVCGDGEAINAMTEAAVQLTRDEFLHMVHWGECASIERNLGYDKDLRMKDDHHVGYFSSTYKGDLCVYLVHSAIEYIFTRRI